MEDSAPDMESNTKSRFDRDYFSRALNTSYIISMFVLMGVYEGIRGPTILDVADLFKTTVQVVSGTYICGSVGAMIGALIYGWLLDKYPKHRDAVCFSILCLYGAPIALMTLLISTEVFYCLSFVAGIGNGGVENAGVVGVLMIWRGRGRDGAPYMHAISFGYSLGTFVGPLLAAPFLSADKEEDPSGHPLAINSTAVANEEDSNINVVHLYVLVGCVIVAAGIGYLIMAIGTCSKKEADKGDENDEETESQTEQAFSRKAILFVGLMCLFYVVYSGAEVVATTYLTTFAVKSDLRAAKVDGAFTTALYFGCFAVFRFLSMFAAAYLKPLTVMGASFLLSIGAAIGLAIAAQTDIIVLQVLVAVLGSGMAAVYATGLLFMEECVVVTNRIGAATTFSAMVGVVVFPFLAGSFVVEYPMSFMYLLLANVAGFVFLFVAAYFVGRTLTK